MDEQFADNPLYVGLFLQTVFEGYGTNSFQAGLDMLEGDEFGLVSPFYGRAAGDPYGTYYEGVPDFMWQHQVGGTPWAVLFGKDGERILSELTWDVSGTLADTIAAALAADAGP